jgi:hypothetical protein
MTLVRSIGLLALLAACGRAPAPAPAPAPNATAPPPTVDSVTLERKRYVAEVMRQIAGRETANASSVFKNLKVLTNVPANRLVAVMDIGYGKSLGVSCTHCHVAGEWEREDKPQKQIARDMMQMNRELNDKLRAIPNLKGQPPVANCTTCHRGQVKPALDIP